MPCIFHSKVFQQASGELEGLVFDRGKEAQKTSKVTPEN
jgi:hypothetical protein